jgi:hypothetical protein
MTECFVCAEEANKMIRCGCGFESCVECTKTYLLGTNMTAHCMKCKVGWGQKFLYTNFGKEWTDSNKDDGYRTHCKKVALTREKSKISETLMELPRIRAEAEAKKQSELLLGQLLEKRRHNLNEMARLKEENAEINRTINELRAQIHPDAVKVHVTTFVCKCPIEGCVGLICRETYRCAACEIKMCKRCREHKVKGHKCDKSTVETIKMLKEDTKPCPVCATQIHRISGCSQMYCPPCKTAFDWNTGMIETGTIHNPHAIEWMREHGTLERDINDVPCGGLLEMNRFIILDNYDREYFNDIDPIHRIIAEIDYKLRQNMPTDPFRDFRLAYVQKQICETTWKQKIFVAERVNARRKANADILTTFRTLGIERFRNFYEEINEIKTAKNITKQFKSFMTDMEEIRKFINKAFQDELVSLGTKTPIAIEENWTWRRNTTVE